jgi:uncharacterized membrane protein
MTFRIPARAHESLEQMWYNWLRCHPGVYAIAYDAAVMWLPRLLVPLSGAPNNEQVVL